MTQPSTPTEYSLPSVSVVICAYADERFGDLSNAIRSLERQTVAPVQIIVAIDRNPTFLERARTAFPKILVVLNRHHPGAGGARNTGVEEATSEIVAFIDDDVQAEPDWLERLLPAFADATTLGAGGRIDPLWNSQRPRWFPEEFDWVIGCTYRGLPDSTAKVRNLISANMAVRRDVFNELGGFLSGFGKTGTASEPEETEFCIRALSRWPGRTWLYVPTAGVHHRVTAERETWRYFLVRCKNEGKGKARMTHHAQVGEDLSSERAYTLFVLPRGVLRGLRDGLRGDFGGVARSAMIILGFVITAVTYAAELRHQRPHANSVDDSSRTSND